MDTQQYRPQSYGIGLLATISTTVTALPAFHYAPITSSKPANENAIEIPLDLSKKVTQLTSPPKKRYREEFDSENVTVVAKIETTPNKPVKKSETTVKKSVKGAVSKEPKRTKVSRKLKFDEDNSSPVSGTIIRPLEEINGNIEHESGDIDPQYNIVEATDEARAEIAAIPNLFGDYRCKLCRIDFEDVFELARHRCSCIVLLEYRCPECGKKFNCPANLASHRRWHKPREQAAPKRDATSDENQFPCIECNKSFKRMAYLKKHQATHAKAKMAASKSYPPSEENSKDSHSSQASNNNNNNNTVYSASYPKSVGGSSSTSMSEFHFVQTKAQVIKYEDDSSSCDSVDSHRLQIITDRFTEEENIAAAVLARLSGSSVIKHTTALAV